MLLDRYGFMESVLLPDQTLIDRLRRGDREAGDALVERHKRLVARAVYDVIRDLGVVEDLIQDIFMKAFRKVDLYDPAQGKFGVWLTTVARNETINYLRRVKRARTVMLEDVGADRPAAADRPSQQFSRKETWSRLMTELHGLSEPARTIVTKRILESISFEQISRLLGRPTETVKSIFYRATASIRDRVATSV